MKCDTSSSSDVLNRHRFFSVVAAATVVITTGLLTACASQDTRSDKQMLVAKGKDLYSIHCVACHQANGQGVPGIYPALAGSAIATGPISAHVDIVVNGVPDTAMPGFGPQTTDRELAAIITYERNAFGNKTGDVVRASQIGSGH